MTTPFPQASSVARQLREDGEFLLAARHWNGGVRLTSEGEEWAIRIDDGVPSAARPDSGDVIEIAGSAAIWSRLLSAVPPRFSNDLGPALVAGLELRSDPLFFTQYYPALMRMIEVARPANLEQRSAPQARHAEGDHDAPVGRYVHLTLDGLDHRVYYEEAGRGIPLLLQHTAGAHGAQWRHLFEVPEITDHFRLIAYDLPFHGKSLPPLGRKWWATPYELTGDFVRQVPVALSRALGLERPVFMGCSVGGALALDLAYHHPDLFRSVISVEGMLKADGDLSEPIYQSFYHPQVSNEFKGRLMHGLTSPLAPEAFRQETIQVYKAGWPPLFLGDLNYYVDDFDLRGKAGEIDTNRVSVHIMNGEYDYSGSWELGEQAHEAIRGSTFTRMDGVGHFPMCEDPERFVSYCLPILESIRDASVA